MILSFLTILTGALLVLTILMQNAKGGLRNQKLATRVIGVKRSSTVIEKATWCLAIAFMALCLY